MRHFLAIALAATSAFAGPTFTNLSPTSPPGGRRSSGVAVRPGVPEVYLTYGGFNAATLADLVALNPQANAWASVVSTIPGRERHSLGYDPVHDVFVIVSGANGFTVQDSVYLLQGSSLAESTPALPGNRPSARVDALLQWIPPLGKFVYFGGRTSIFANTHVNDTWTLDVGDGGVTWSQLSVTAPPAVRGAVCSAWDPDHQQVLMFGGEGASDLADTWTFSPDGGNWNPVTVAGTPPSARGFSACAWDPNLKQLVLYGGQISAGPTGGLFSFDLSNKVWTSHAPAVNPGNLSDAAASYSPVLNGIVFFAGRTAGTTYTNSSWLLRFNQPPVVDAGPDQTVGENVTVTLGGSVVDPDADPVTVAWTQVLGPAVTLSNPASMTPSFTSPSVFVSTPLKFVCTGADPTSNTSASVSVTVNNTINDPPVANAGSDFAVASGAMTMLSGAGTDPNGDAIVGVTWAQVAGPAVTLSSTSSLSPTFTAPVVAAATVLSFTLVVTDGTLSSPPDPVFVTVAAGAIDAGSDAGSDAGAADAGADGGAMDGGNADAGPSDGGGGLDAGNADGGADAGMSDAGAGDGGVADGGAVDAGAGDAGSTDGGSGAPDVYSVGCGCAGSPASPAWFLLAALGLAVRRRRQVSSARNTRGLRSSPRHADGGRDPTRRPSRRRAWAGRRDQPPVNPPRADGGAAALRRARSAARTRTARCSGRSGCRRGR